MVLVAGPCKGQRRLGGTSACCTHFLATDTSRHVGVTSHVRRQECARGVQGRPKCASSTPGGRGAPDSPLAEAGPIWRASPPSLVLQLTHRLAATTAYQYTILEGGKLWARTSHTPRLPLGAISAHSNSGAPTCVTHGWLGQLQRPVVRLINVLIYATSDRDNVAI